MLTYTSADQNPSRASAEKSLSRTRGEFLAKMDRPTRFVACASKFFKNFILTRSSQSTKTFCRSFWSFWHFLSVLTKFVKIGQIGFAFWLQDPWRRHFRGLWGESRGPRDLEVGSCLIMTWSKTVGVWSPLRISRGAGKSQGLWGRLWSVWSKFGQILASLYWARA